MNIPARSKSKRLRRVNSLDIAYLAGVSQPTVSRALRGSPLVSTETRERILELAREHNYKVDSSASNLRTKHSNTIAILLHEESRDTDAPGGASMINPFFLTIIGGITKAAAARDYNVLLSFQQMSENWVRDYEDCNKAEGIIVLGYGSYTDYMRKASLLEEAHAITWGPVLRGQPGHFVGCDNRHGGLIATRHLTELGHRRIAFLGRTSHDSPEFRRRFHGYRDALCEAGLESGSALSVPALWSEQSGYESAAVLIDKGVEFSAIFCACDQIAIGAIQCLRARGLRVPEDISIIGFDDIPMVAHLTPPLTSIRQDPLEAGEVLVDSLLKIIDGESITPQLIEPRLIVRGSTGQASLDP